MEKVQAWGVPFRFFLPRVTGLQLSHVFSELCSPLDRRVRISVYVQGKYKIEMKKQASRASIVHITQASSRSVLLLLSSLSRLSLEPQRTQRNLTDIFCVPGSHVFAL